MGLAEDKEASGTLDCGLQTTPLMVIASGLMSLFIAIVAIGIAARTPLVAAPLIVVVLAGLAIYEGARGAYLTVVGILEARAPLVSITSSVLDVKAGWSLAPVWSYDGRQWLFSWSCRMLLANGRWFVVSKQLADRIEPGYKARVWLTPRLKLARKFAIISAV